MKQTTIFRQLLLNILFPAVLALLLVGFLNFNQTRKILIKSSKEKNSIITQEISQVLELQDLALAVLEMNLDNQMEAYSNMIVKEFFKDTKGIENADLRQIQAEIGMDPEFEDIYVISRDGIVVNTTYEKDLNLNFFDFGEEHKRHLLEVFHKGKFSSERFVIESSTARLKKYTYQPTLDGKYIVELGVYSYRADEIISVVRGTLKQMEQPSMGIESVDLFIKADKVISLDQSTSLSDKYSDIMLQTFENKDTISFFVRENGRRLHYEYMYVDRKNTDLYKGSVIRIIADKSEEYKSLRNELLKFFSIFLVTLIGVIFMIAKKTKVITEPIKKLVENVNRITNGHFYERAEVIGNNEITQLSKHFNHMISELEVLYNELEQKVRDRTAEVMRQKEEIEAQRDKIFEQNKHITDSIRYAKRIQSAILPSDETVQSYLRDSFILYMPKDIVSGDFYWVDKRDENVFFAAVDCTGHGVPGAFMSIVGNNQLNYAVNVKGARRPSEILNELNIGVSNTLNHGADKQSIKDGMDISLCNVDFEKRKLIYAGAYNPLYLVRNGELIKIDADKFPVGAFDEKKLRAFADKEIDLIPGDVIYIFSDGYADQFGGPEGRKFMYKAFRELLTNIASKPMLEQREILEKTLRNWIGKLDQVDDILVIGVRVN